MPATKPIACRDCRFHYNDSSKCWHPDVVYYNRTGEEHRPSLRDMREYDGACGWEAKLFEAPPPRSRADKLKGWMIAAGIVLVLWALVHFR